MSANCSNFAIDCWTSRHRILINIALPVPSEIPSSGQILTLPASRDRQVYQSHFRNNTLTPGSGDLIIEFGDSPEILQGQTI